jgi:hypothetical protein
MMRVLPITGIYSDFVRWRKSLSLLPRPRNRAVKNLIVIDPGSAQGFMPERKMGRTVEAIREGNGELHGDDFYRLINRKGTLADSPHLFQLK